jgi:hypothetical protein
VTTAEWSATLVLMLKRVRCLLIDHRWVKTPYPDGDTADAFYLRCKKCGRSRDMRSSGVDGAMGGGMGPWHG